MPRKYRKLATSKDLTRLMTRYYATRKVVGKVRPLAWVTSGAPVEILIGMGVATVYPENYGALVGSQRATVPLAQVAEDQGWIVVELEGQEADIEQGITWAISKGVRVDIMDESTSDS